MKILTLLRSIRYLIALFFCSLCIENIEAQDSWPRPEEIAAADIRARVEKFELDTERSNLEINRYRHRTDHYREVYTIRENAYKRQGAFSWVITIVVIVLVLGGLYLSYLQFKAEYVSRSKIKSGDPQPSSLKISKDGLELSSSVIGLFVLAFSLLFFLTYVQHVFKIQEIENDQYLDKQIINSEKPIS